MTLYPVPPSNSVGSRLCHLLTKVPAVQVREEERAGDCPEALSGSSGECVDTVEADRRQHLCEYQASCCFGGMSVLGGFSLL